MLSSAFASFNQRHPLPSHAGTCRCMQHASGSSSRTLRDAKRPHQRIRVCAAVVSESNAAAQRFESSKVAGSITAQAHAAWRDVILPGDTVVDATCGNGYDAVALCRMVGAAGELVMIDIQAEAIDATRQRLQQELSSESTPQLHFVEGCHSQLQAVLEQQGLADCAPSVIAFNLGYLPTSHRKEVTTQLDTTVVAVRQALEVLRPGGCLTVAAYIGHEGGLEEYEAVVELLSSLERRNWVSSQRQLLNCKDAPRLLLAYKLR